MESHSCVFLGIKVKPGPIERFKVENFSLGHTVDKLKTEAEKKTQLPSGSLELIYHGKILKDEATLQDSGVKNGEMVHVVKKRVLSAAPTLAPLSDAELQQLNFSLTRTLGCSPNSPGWSRAMQLLNDESVMSEILEHAPSLNDDCVTLSILHEVELLAALGSNLQTISGGVDCHRTLAHALLHLTRLVRARGAAGAANDNVPTSGFAYSLEALSDDEDVEDEDAEDGERNPITQEQLAAALQAATEAVSTSSRSGSQSNLMRLLQAARANDANRASESPSHSTGSGSGSRSAITPQMFSDAISDAIHRAGSASANASAPPPPPPSRPAPNPPDQPAPRTLPYVFLPATTSEAGREGDFTTQLQRMHEMGLVDDALNVRALLICSGDVNSAINLVFSGAIADE